MNFDAFSHGQIKSKLWLCERLEPYIPDKAKIAILGSWYNVLGFMMAVRRPDKYESILGIDIDPEAIQTSKLICNTWTIDSPKITNVCRDVNKGEHYSANVVINCSPEHIQGSDWFSKINVGSVVCIQTSNITDTTEPWLIKTPFPTIDIFKESYPLDKVYYCDSLRIQYDAWGYDRFMIIGVK